MRFPHRQRSPSFNDQLMAASPTHTSLRARRRHTPGRRRRAAGRRSSRLRRSGSERRSPRLLLLLLLRLRVLGCAWCTGALLFLATGQLYARGRAVIADQLPTARREVGTALQRHQTNAAYYPCSPESAVVPASKGRELSAAPRALTARRVRLPHYHRCCCGRVLGLATALRDTTATSAAATRAVSWNLGIL